MIGFCLRIFSKDIFVIFGICIFRNKILGLFFFKNFKVFKGFWKVVNSFREGILVMYCDNRF